MCGTRPALPPAIRCLRPTWRPADCTRSRDAAAALDVRLPSMYRRGPCRRGCGSPERVGIHQCPRARGGLQAWKDWGFELFRDVNSYAKAFGELVESRRHTPSLTAGEVASLIARKANIRILDVRRFDEYATMNIRLGQRARRRACCAQARRRPIPTPPSSSIAPAAPARSSAPSR